MRLLVYIQLRNEFLICPMHFSRLRDFRIVYLPYPVDDPYLLQCIFCVSRSLSGSSSRSPSRSPTPKPVARRAAAAAPVAPAVQPGDRQWRSISPAAGGWQPARDVPHGFGNGQDAKRSKFPAIVRLIPLALPLIFAAFLCLSLHALGTTSFLNVGSGQAERSLKGIPGVITGGVF